MTDTNKPEYLLDDDEFAALMAREYQAAGRPQNQVAQQRVWAKISARKTRKKGPWITAAVGMAAAVLLLVVLPKQSATVDPNPLKAGGDAIAYALQIDPTNGPNPRLAVSTETAIVFSLYGTRSEGTPQRITPAQELAANQRTTIDLEAATVDTVQRICLVAAGNAAELQNMENMIDLLWPKLDDKTCVNLR